MAEIIFLNLKFTKIFVLINNAVWIKSGNILTEVTYQSVSS